MASYREAINWLANNDDCYWLGDRDISGPILSVAASLVRDLWNKQEEVLAKDLRKELKKVYPNHEVFK